MKEKGNIKILRRIIDFNKYKNSASVIVLFLQIQYKTIECKSGIKEVIRWINVLLTYLMMRFSVCCACLNQKKDIHVTHAELFISDGYSLMKSN